MSLGVLWERLMAGDLFDLTEMMLAVLRVPTDFLVRSGCFDEFTKDLL